MDAVMQPSGFPGVGGREENSGVSNFWLIMDSTQVLQPIPLFKLGFLTKHLIY